MIAIGCILYYTIFTNTLKKIILTILDLHQLFSRYSLNLCPVFYFHIKHIIFSVKKWKIINLIIVILIVLYVFKTSPPPPSAGAIICHTICTPLIIKILLRLHDNYYTNIKHDIFYRLYLQNVG